MGNKAPSINDIVSQGKLESTGSNSWLLKSPSGGIYAIRLDGDKLFCDCEAWKYSRCDWCKHCEALSRMVDMELVMGNATDNTEEEVLQQ